MDIVDIPYKFQYKWGENATAGFVTDPIPATTTAPAASQSLGFPPETSQPIASGGTPPNINDFNGAYQYATSWLQWFQAGAPVAYDGTFATNIAGYPAGAVLASSTVPGQTWRSTVDGNTSDPDAGGANWVVANAGRLLNKRVFTAPGAVTYTPTAGTNSVLVELVGGGGAGGGTAVTGVGEVAAGAGGGAGGYAAKRITSAFSGVTLTVGVGGTGFFDGAGSNGGTSSFGALVTATGGTGGSHGASTVANGFPQGSGPGGVGASGDVNAVGGAGLYALYFATATSGLGGQSYFGGGAVWITGTNNGNSGVSPGSGGSGGVQSLSSAGTTKGGNGAPGMVIVWEYT